MTAKSSLTRFFGKLGQMFNSRYVRGPVRFAAVAVTFVTAVALVWLGDAWLVGASPRGNMPLVSLVAVTLLGGWRTGGVMAACGVVMHLLGYCSGWSVIMAALIPLIAWFYD